MPCKWSHMVCMRTFQIFFLFFSMPLTQSVWICCFCFIVSMLQLSDGIEKIWQIQKANMKILCSRQRNTHTRIYRNIAFFSFEVGTKKTKKKWFCGLTHKTGLAINDHRMAFSQFAQICGFGILSHRIVSKKKQHHTITDIYRQADTPWYLWITNFHMKSIYT